VYFVWVFMGPSPTVTSCRCLCAFSLRRFIGWSALAGQSPNVVQQSYSSEKASIELTAPPQSQDLDSPKPLLTVSQSILYHGLAKKECQPVVGWCNQLAMASECETPPSRGTCSCMRCNSQRPSYRWRAVSSSLGRMAVLPFNITLCVRPASCIPSLFEACGQPR
jgi:hypothetical protein